MGTVKLISNRVLMPIFRKSVANRDNLSLRHRPRPDKLTMAKASQGGSPVVSPRPMPTPVTGQLVNQPEADKKPITKLQGPALRPPIV